MTKEQQRIAIAKLLPNLIHIETYGMLDPDLRKPMRTVFLFKDTELIRDWYEVKERDWLWIMHEAEKVLTHEQYHDIYVPELHAICSRDKSCMYSATAAQRAEAFLRCLNLWPGAAPDGGGR